MEEIGLVLSGGGARGVAHLISDCLVGKCDKIIGSHVNKLEKNEGKYLSRLQVLERCFHLAAAEKVSSQAKLCDVLIEPMLTKYNMFEMRFSRSVIRRPWLRKRESYPSKMGLKAISPQESPQKTLSLKN